MEEQFPVVDRICALIGEVKILDGKGPVHGVYIGTVLSGEIVDIVKGLRLAASDGDAGSRRKLHGRAIVGQSCARPSGQGDANWGSFQDDDGADGVCVLNTAGESCRQK